VGVERDVREASGSVLTHRVGKTCLSTASFYSRCLPLCMALLVLPTNIRGEVGRLRVWTKWCKDSEDCWQSKSKKIL